MFEFEASGDMNALRNLAVDLLEYLGFERPECFEYEAFSSPPRRAKSLAPTPFFKGGKDIL